MFLYSVTGIVSASGGLFIEGVQCMHGLKIGYVCYQNFALYRTPFCRICKRLVMEIWLAMPEIALTASDSLVV